MEKDEDGRAIPRQFALRYYLYASKPDVLSVVFSKWVYLDGPHGHPSSEAFTHDLRAKKQMRPGDIFPHWQKTKKELTPLLKASIDDFDASCPDLKPEELSPNDTKFYLSPDGLTVVYRNGYAPPDQWGCASLSVDKEDLEGIGADMRWWVTQ